MNLVVKKIKKLEEKDRIRIDKFILDENTNGEFVNSIKYLDYHPKDRFNDDSIVIIDKDSGYIICVVMAASTIEDPDILISHPGTTFSGLIWSKKLKYNDLLNTINTVEEYYKPNYKKIIFKMAPSHYSKQPSQNFEFALIDKGYNYGVAAMANIIDLFKVKNESHILGLYSSGKRNHVKKSIKENQLNFLKMKNVSYDIWGSINSNLKSKFDTHTTHSYNEIEELIKKFPENIVPYVVYKNDEEYGAFALVYKFKNVFHTQYLDMNYSLSKHYPNLYLIHYLIKEALDEGYRFFSFGSSTESGGSYLNEGLYNYKNGFGGGAILLPQYTKKID